MMFSCRSPNPRRGAIALVAASTFVGACSSDSSNSSTSTQVIDESAGAPTSQTPAQDDVATTDDASATTTEAPTDDEADGGDPVEAEPDPDAAAPTVDEVCDSLGAEGFESRVDVLSRFLDANDDDRSGIEQTCGEDLTRLDAARALRSAANALDQRDDPIALTNLRCADGDYSFIAENTSDVAVGVHLAFRVFADDDDEPTSSANYPIVIWSLEPGGKQGITGDFDEPDTDSYRCNLNARVFLSDVSAAGAGIPGETDPARTGDDPTEWIGALLEAETVAIGSGDIDAAADTEDLRSVFYDDVFDATQGSETASRVPTAIRICSATVDQPDPDRMSLVYFISYSDGESFFRHGLFRRGADGQWRWLSAAQYFRSDDFADCAI